MRSKKNKLSSFSQSHHACADSVRPDNPLELMDYVKQSPERSLLARGAGLSYNDSCLSTNQIIVDTTRLNHFIEFDKATGTVVCQSHVTFQELLLLDQEYIPPVIPGTLQATLGGGVAHDVHGKNNPVAGSLGQHILWLDVLVAGQVIRCSKKEKADLFYATIGGAGLSGILLKIALRLKKASHFVKTENQRVESIDELLQCMSTLGVNHDYQVAWIDLLRSEPRAILSVANHCHMTNIKNNIDITIPKLPLNLIHSWNMACFNAFYFHFKSKKQIMSLKAFNNPLDTLKQWNRLYGPKGLIQFQAVFGQDAAAQTILNLQRIMKQHQATPTLAVLKLFTQPGIGYLSFCQPGFTIAIDFAHTPQAIRAIKAMNQYLAEIKGRVYLAKDLLLTPEQFNTMYDQKNEWTNVLKKYHCTTRSDLSQRLGITTSCKESGSL